MLIFATFLIIFRKFCGLRLVLYITDCLKQYKTAIKRIDDLQKGDKRYGDVYIPLVSHNGNISTKDYTLPVC